MKLEKLFTFISIYINRRKIKKVVNKLDKLPRYIAGASLPEHEKRKLQHALKLAVLQLFNPKSKKEKREFLKQ